MKVTEQLKAEHNGIKLMLNILDKMCTKLESADMINPKHLDEVLEFIRIFIDKCHHTKEEELLFPALERAGIPKEKGPIGVMLLEHSKGREYIKALGEAIDEYKRGSETAALKIIENAKGYIRILLAHIDKEDNVLYPMADARLSEKIQNEMADEFERIELERIGAGKHEEFHKTLIDLKKVYLD